MAEKNDYEQILSKLCSEVANLKCEIQSQHKYISVLQSRYSTLVSEISDLKNLTTLAINKADINSAKISNWVTYTEHLKKTTDVFQNKMNFLLSGINEHNTDITALKNDVSGLWGFITDDINEFERI